jgi:hypothetical protein
LYILWKLVIIDHVPLTSRPAEDRAQSSHQPEDAASGLVTNQRNQVKNAYTYTANIYDHITMELQPFIVVVRSFTVDFNYSAQKQNL